MARTSRCCCFQTPKHLCAGLRFVVLSSVSHAHRQPILRRHLVCVVVGDTVGRTHAIALRRHREHRRRRSYERRGGENDDIRYETHDARWCVRRHRSSDEHLVDSTRSPELVREQNRVDIRSGVCEFSTTRRPALAAMADERHRFSRIGFRMLNEEIKFRTVLSFNFVRKCSPSCELEPQLHRQSQSFAASLVAPLANRAPESSTC